MALYLIEFPDAPDEVADLFARAAERAVAARAEVIERQHATGLRRAYLVVSAADPEGLRGRLRDLPAHEVSEVRLVGATLEQARRANGDANFLVEWDLPEGLTMDRYLTRKKEKAPLYAKVPEVSFRRTYVREDMDKCLCLYDAPDEDCVRRARDAVETPIDRLSGLER
ncbi:MAG TPA: DUF4242 domain-containing protein [Candidatus Limnocylindria bacterium]|jgi:hypothetical protein|nr:DUF4242 domain-containing protein [Candidatus Limnocylindria bacterium]